jgi:large subunit ribosomal protein L9
MEVIIIKPTKKIKKIGEVVKVKKGYARNFLLPKGFALRATEENKNKFEDFKKDLDVKYHSHHQDALAILQKVQDKAVTFISQSLEDGKLFGSISSKQIAKQLNQDLNIELKNDQITLEAAIKNIGVYRIEVVLHHDVVANVFVNIARTESEALTQMNNFKAALASVQTPEISEAVLA